MRKLGITLVVILAILIIAALVAPSLIDVNRYRGRIQSELQQKLGRQVLLGQMHLSILPLSFKADNTVIAEDPRFGSGKAFAQVQQLAVSAKLMPLIHGDVQLQSLELKQPKIELIRNAQGVWNFASLGQSSAQTSQPSQQAPQKQAAPTEQKPSQQQPEQQKAGSKSFSLQDLKITDGQLAITDFQKHQPRSVYDHIDLRLVNFAPDKAFDLEVAAHLPGEGNQTVKLNGNAGPIDNATPANTHFKGNLELQNVSIAGVQKFLNSQSLAGMDAVVTGKADVENNPQRFGSSGSLKLEQARVHGHDIGYPITADYAMQSDMNTGALNIQKGNIKLGSTPLSITGTVDTKSTPAQLNVKLNASDVSIEEAARLAAAMGVAFNPGMKIAGRLTADVHAQGPTSQPALNGKLEARNLSISGKDLHSPVNVPAIDLALTPTDIRSNDFTASTGGTSVNGRFTLSQYTTAAPAIDANLRTANANVGELLNIANAYGVSAAEGMSGSGTISMDVHAAGPVKNSTAMNFSGSGALQNAEIKTPTLTEPLKVRNANLRFSQNSAVLENLAASLGSSNANGSVTLRNFQNPEIQFALSADKVNVAEIEKLTGTAAPQKTASNRDTGSKGFWSVVPRAEAAPAAQPSFLTKATGNGTLKVGNIIYNDLTLNNVQSKVALDHGIIHLDPVTALIAGGQETGNIVVDTRANPVTYAITSKLDKVDANKLLSSVSSVKQTLYGLLAANANAKFASGQNIASSLNGNVNMNLVNGKLANVDLLYELANIGKFLSSGKAISQHSFTNLVKLAGNFNIKNGIAQTNDLQAAIDGGTLSADGLVNLVDQSLNMHLTAVLNKGMTQSVGGTGIGGFMNTALANKNGELVMPVLVTGSMAHPHLAPDVEKIARMKLNNLLPTSSNPGALTSGILGGILGGKNPQGMPQSDQTNQQKGGLQGILGNLGKKQSQQQPASNGQQQPQGAQQQQQQPGGLSDILNGVLNKKKQQQQNPPPPQNPPPK